MPSFRGIQKASGLPLFSLNNSNQLSTQQSHHTNYLPTPNITMALAAIINPVDTSEALLFYYEKVIDNRPSWQTCFELTKNPKNDDIYSLAVRHSSVSGGRDQLFVNRNTIGSRVKAPPSDLAVTSFLGLVSSSLLVHTGDCHYVSGL